MNRKLHFQGALLLAGMAAALTPMAARSAPPEPSAVTVTVTAVGKKDAASRAVKRDDVELYQGKERKQVADWRRGETLYLADIEETFGPGAIRREAGTRRIALEAGVDGRDLGSTASDIRSRFTKQLQLPPGYFFDVGGKVEGQERAARSLAVAIGVALFAVFLLLYLALDSMAEAAMILATIPVAFVGSIVALLLTGETWNVSSLVGLIGLFGIAVQNGLVLVTQTRALVAEGKPLGEAIREASIGRVRPKLMTAVTAICGLLPILLLRMHGTEIERPLAIVMTGGLVTSTIFILLVLPTIYPWFVSTGGEHVQ
jgi:heavy metal efflux system protein